MKIRYISEYNENAVFETMEECKEYDNGILRRYEGMPLMLNEKGERVIPSPFNDWSNDVYYILFNSEEEVEKFNSTTKMEQVYFEFTPSIGHWFYTETLDSWVSIEMLNNMSLKAIQIFNLTYKQN